MFHDGLTVVAETNNHSDNDDSGDLRSDSDFLTNESWIGRARVLDFGKGSVGDGQDSRYWDKDDRRREEDYNEDVMEQTSGGSRNENVDKDHSDIDDDYDDFFYFHDAHVEEYDDSRNMGAF
ncbi:hypothetical protein K1719_024990 [Acacia pycnantha]|nr:hypothetical protein K1719_024990 [Acacia pycnantha]